MYARSVHDLSLDAVRVFAGLTLAAALVALLAARLRVPAAVGLLLLGLAVGALLPAGTLVVTPDLVLAVLLPGLVFDAAFRTHVDPFRWARARILVLVVPGVLITAVVVAAVLWLAAGVAFTSGIVVGAMVAATDPAAVIDTFRRSPAPARLRTLVEGESLFNDGTGLVLFAIVLRLAGQDVGVPEMAGRFVAALVISVLVGAAIAWLAIRLHHLIDDHLVEGVMTVAAAYGAFVVADFVGSSGLLATAVAGLLIGSRGRRTAISAASAEALDLAWEVVAFILTALTFVLVGTAIPVGTLSADAGPIAAGILAVALARLIVVYGLLGAGGWLLRRVSARRQAGIARPAPDDLPAGWLHVLYLAGIRGAVTVALALAVPLDFPDRQLIQAVTLGIVVVTMLVLGLAAGPLVPRLLRAEPVVPDWPPTDGAAADPDLAESIAETDVVPVDPEEA